MEDALVRSKNIDIIGSSQVLILVLMEDALVHVNVTAFENYIRCLNPCFNGRCTSTRHHGQ